jgi:ABC-type methionine transport system permease subunit
MCGAGGGKLGADAGELGVVGIGELAYRAGYTECAAEVSGSEPLRLMASW